MSGAGTWSSEHGLGEWMHCAPIPLREDKAEIWKAESRNRKMKSVSLRSSISQFLLSALPSALARGLQPFGVNSRVMRIGTRCAKGFDLADFTDAFARFLNCRTDPSPKTHCLS